MSTRNFPTELKLTVVRSYAAEQSAVIAERIEAQRERIFQAMSIVEIACKVLDSDGEVGDDQEAQPLWWALSGVKELLNDVAGKLEPGVVMAEVSHG